MGLIKAVEGAIKGAFADQWLEIIEPYDMDDNVVFTKGILTRRGENTKGTSDVVSNGSRIRVYPNQFMMLVEDGKVIDYTAEEGVYEVNNSSSPSLFNGEFKNTLFDALERIKFGGNTPKKQEVFYINLQEIKGIKFGTKTPVNYFDNFYNSELFLRFHGTYSIKITNPLLFYIEVVPKNTTRLRYEDISAQYQSEFMTALQATINQLSVDGIRISHVQSKSVELSKYMAETLDSEWEEIRGIQIQAVGIESISYTDESSKLINMRNEGAMLSDASIREGYMQGHIARGMEAAGSNSSGAAQAFMGMGVGMGAAGSYMAAASASNMKQMEAQNNANHADTLINPNNDISENAWLCECGHKNTGRFCSNCGSPKKIKVIWKCSCGHENEGKFCSNCGNPKPETWKCSCGHENEGKFCEECGSPKSE